MKYIDISGNATFLGDETETLSLEYAFYERLIRNNPKSDIRLLDKLFATEEEYFDFKTYIYPIKDRIILLLIEFWNKKFNINLSVQQANIFCALWLNRNISKLYCQFEKVKRVSASDDCFTIGYDTNECIDSFPNDIKATLIYGKVFSHLGIPIEKRPIDKAVQKSFPLYSRIVPFYAKKAGRLAKRFINKRRAIDIPPVEITGQTETLLLYTRIRNFVLEDIIKDSNGKVVDIPETWLGREFAGVTDTPYNPELRHQMFEDFAPQNDFEDFLKETLPELIPSEWVENFTSVYLRAEELASSWNIRKIYSSAQVGVNVYASALAAVCEGKGAEFFNIQHTGAYTAYHGFSYDEQNAFGKLITWGWTSEKSFGKEIPIAVGRAPEAIWGYNNKKRFLYVTNNSSTVLGFIGLDGDDIRFYSKEHFNFLDGLSKENRKKIITRLHIQVGDFDDILYRYMKDRRYRDIALEDMNERPIAESIKMSELVICDMISSTHIEAMVMGAPVMFFDGWDVVLKDKKVMDLLGKLKEVGIFFDSPKELAEYLNGISDIEAWWEDNQRQKVIHEYLDYVAHDYENRLKCWKKEILS